MSDDKSSKSKALLSNGGPSADKTQQECFVLMPVTDPEGYELGHFRQVYEDLFVPACSSAGYKAVRADEVRQTNLIHLDVLQKIIDSPMALCDLSSRNPNVLFELGLRQAFDKPVVLVQEIGTPPIFDIQPLRYTNYHKEMLYRDVVNDQKTITDAILATREDISNTKSINSIVKLLSLTHSASLVSVAEADKDSAVLQIVMSELGALRTEVKSLVARGEAVEDPELSFHALDTLDEFIQFINLYGLERYLRACGFTAKTVRMALKNAKNVNALYTGLKASARIPEDKLNRYVGSLPISEVQAAFNKAKRQVQVPESSLTE